MNKIIQQSSRNPRQLIRIDAIGAFVTALLLMLIAKNFSLQFGISKAVLSLLSYVALLICCYSAICSLFLKNISSPIMVSIAMINTAYCILSIGLMIYLHKQITLIGIIYFFIEIVIISYLIWIEYKISRLINLKKT